MLLCNNWLGRKGYNNIWTRTKSLWLLGFDYPFFCSDAVSKKYETRGEKRQIPADREEMTETQLESMLELRPPNIMPQGNVGTPTRYT